MREASIAMMMRKNTYLIRSRRVSVLSLAPDQRRHVAVRGRLQALLANLFHAAARKSVFTI